jgi:hypothetical protein
MGIFDDVIGGGLDWLGRNLKDVGVTGSFSSGGSEAQSSTNTYGGVPGVNYPFLGGYEELYGSTAPTPYPGGGSPFGGAGIWPEQPAPKPAYQASPDMVPISAINEYYDVFGPTVRADVNRMFGGRTEIPYQEAVDRLGNPFEDASPESIGLMQGAAGYLGRRRELINTSNTAGGYAWNAESGQWELDPDSPAAQRGPKVASQGLMDQLQGGTATGMSWNAGSGKWDRVASGVPELVVDPETQTVFYKGMALTDQQYSQLVMNGPTSAPGQAIIRDALGTIQRGIDWESRQQGPQVEASYTGQTPYRIGGLDLPGRQDVPFTQQMQQTLQAQGGYVPTGMGPESDVDIERMPQISVDDAQFREIDFQADELMKQGMIQSQVAYSEPLIRDLRDDAYAKAKEDSERRGLSGTAVAAALQRDVLKPYDDRIIANRQLAVGRAIEMWYGAKERVAIQDTANWQAIQLANMEKDENIGIRNVGFLAQISIAGAELSSRLRGQLSVASTQAGTARRGQTIAGLQNLQNLIAEAGISQRGQEISAGLQARGQDVTQRSQDIQAAQEAGRQDLTAQQSDLDSWLRVLGIDSTVAIEQTRTDLKTLENMLGENRFDRELAMRTWLKWEEDKLQHLGELNALSRRTVSERQYAEASGSGFGLNIGSKKKTKKKNGNGGFIPTVTTRGGNGNGGGEDVYEGPTDNEGEIGPDPWPNSGPTVGAALYPWDSPKSGREPPWFDPAQLEWGPNFEERYPPWHQPLGDDAERGPHGRVTRSADGGFTREKAISQYPPATLSDVPRLDPKFFENNPYPFDAQENDGSPPAGYTIPELQFLPTPGFNVGYVATSRDYLNNYSEFQQRNILHALRFRKAANGQIHGHQRMGSGAPTGYPGGFLTWPWYEQDRFVYEGGRQAHTSGPGLPSGLGSTGSVGGSGATYGQGGGRTGGGDTGFSSAGRGNPYAGTAHGGGGAGFIGICWVAAELYGWYTPDWYAARHFMVDVWQGKAADKFRAAYLKHGPQWAEEIRRDRTLRTKAKGLFDKFVRLGREREE